MAHAETGTDAGAQGHREAHEEQTDTDCLLQRFLLSTAQAMESGLPLCLLMVDIDHFKHFNDTYGHLEGDALLKGLADVVRGTIRRSDAKPSYEVDIAWANGKLTEKVEFILMNSTDYGPMK